MLPQMIPPSMYPVNFVDLVKIFVGYLSGKKSNFVEMFADYVSQTFYFDLYSGREALYLILLTLKQIQPEKKKVLVSVITCPSVVNAILKADLIPLFYDVSLETFGTENASVKEKIDDQTLAVISNSLYGIPCDLQELQKITEENNVFLIEDNAQVLGAKDNQEQTGQFGHFSFYSFGKSKNLTAMEGGMVCTNDPDLANLFGRIYTRAKRPSCLAELVILFQLLLYYLVIKPHIFIYAVLLKKDLSFKHSNSFKRIKRMSRMQKIIGEVLFKKIDEVREQRNSAAMIWKRKLGKINTNKRQFDVRTKSPEYIRYPVLVEDPQQRERLIKEFRRKGLWVVKSIYPIIAEESEKYPNADFVDRRLLLFPVNRYILMKNIKATYS